MSDVRSADGTLIAFETVGTGPAVILVDGAMCYRDAGPMRAVARLLAPHHTVVLYDRRGRGASGDADRFSVQCEIDDVNALIGAIGGSAALFGMSSGGAVACLAAAALGSAVTRLAVFEPPYMPESARPAAAAYTEELTAALAQGDADRAVSAFLTRTGAPKDAIERTRQSPAWPGMTQIAKTLAYDDAAMGDSSIPAAAATIGVPTLALAGGDSPDFMRWGARQLAEAIPGAAYDVLDDQGHDVDPAVLAARLSSFLLGNAQRFT